ncbi:MAG: DUF4097 family beta strand repeat protein [Balneola sp.]
MKYLSLLLFIILPTSLLAQSGEKEGTFNAPNIDQLMIRVDAGMTINITGSDTEQITYTYEFDGNDQAYNHLFENFDPKFSNNGGSGYLNIEFPAHKKKNVNYRIKKNILTLNIPSQIELELVSRYSKIDVSNITRTTRIENRSGSVKLNNIGQSVTVSNEYGNIDVNSINGDVDITSRSSRVDAKNITGNLKVRSNYSKMNLSKITGILNIENKSGTVNAFDLDSDFRANGDYTNYELTNVRGDIQISNKNGTISIDNAESVLISGDYSNVKASNLKGDRVMIESRSAKLELSNVLGSVIVNGGYLNIELENISNDVSITNRSGKITAKDIDGSFIINGDYNKIKLDDFKGSEIQMENRSGDIEINALNDLNLINIETSYTPIKLNLSSPFSGNIRFHVTYGRLSHPYKLNDATLVDERNSTKIEGTVGNGNGRMYIESRNGNVTINQ